MSRDLYTCCKGMETCTGKNNSKVRGTGGRRQNPVREGVYVCVIWVIDTWVFSTLFYKLFLCLKYFVSLKNRPKWKERDK